MSYAASTIRSIQRGTITVASGSGIAHDATLGTTLTNTAKAQLTLLGVIAGDSSSFPGVYLTLQSTTTIRANVDDTSRGAAWTVGYQVVEYF